MKIWRILKWTIISIATASVVSLALLITLFYNLTADSCESSIINYRENIRGDTVRSEIEICKFCSTVINNSITIQLHTYPRIWPRRTLLYYDAADNRDPVLLWLNDNLLSVDLGKVYWLSSPVDRIGNIHITYVYIKIDPPS